MVETQEELNVVHDAVQPAPQGRRGAQGRHLGLQEVHGGRGGRELLQVQDGDTQGVPVGGGHAHGGARHLQRLQQAHGGRDGTDAHADGGVALQEGLQLRKGEGVHQVSLLVWGGAAVPAPSWSAGGGSHRGGERPGTEARVGVRHRIVHGFRQARGDVLVEALRDKEALLLRLARQVHMQVREDLQEAVGHFGIGDDSLLVPQLLELPLGDQGVVARGVSGRRQQVQEHLGQPLDVQDDQVLGDLGDAAGDHPLWAQVGEQLAFFSC